MLVRGIITFESDIKRFGFLGISERVALLGGRLELRNQADGGLLMEIEIPHPRVDTTLDISVS